MKHKITKADYEKLNEALKPEYKDSGDGENFVLNLEDVDIGTLESKRAAADKYRREALDRVKDLETREQELLKKLEGAGKDDIEKLRVEYQGKIEALRKQHEEHQAAQIAEKKQTMISEAARKFASDNFTIPSAMEMLIKQRLSVEDVNGELVLRALDEQGKPSINSVSEVFKSFLDNKEYSGIIKKDVGSGGGSQGTNNHRPGDKQMQRGEFEKLAPAEQYKFMKDGGSLVDG